MGDDKFILMNMDDERSKKIAEVLGNKTCKKIIDHLSEVKEASEKDISDKLGIPINTAEYNLKKLIESGLVEKTKNFFWSVKGRKIDMFKLAKKHIVISPKSSRVNMEKLKSVLPVIFIAAAVIVVIALLMFGQSGFNTQTGKTSLISDSGKLKQFSSYLELQSFLNASTNSGNSYNHYGVRGGAEELNAVPAAAPAAAGVAKGLSATAASDNSAAGGSASVFSHTNNQVEGVDEPDIVKNDDKYIYTLSGNRIVIVNAYPATDMKVVSEINFSNENSVSNIFINGDKLVVFGSSYEAMPYSSSPEAMTGSVRCFGCGNSVQKTKVYIYDITDRSKPNLTTNISFDGSYVDSRMINNYVYLISSNYANRNYPVPLYSVNGVEKQVPVKDIYYSPYVSDNYVFTTVGAVNLDSNEVNSKVYLTGSTEQVYVSENNIYLTYQKTFDYSNYNKLYIQDVFISVAPSDLKDSLQKIIDSDISDYDKISKAKMLIETYSMSLKGSEKESFDSKLAQSVNDFDANITKEMQKTVVQKISIDKMDISYQSSGEVPGTLLNSFSMDEYDGNLRVATTTGDNFNSKSSNNVYVLDSGLSIIGKLEGIAPGETIYSARFMGKRAYLVTFRQIDPLFVVDLSNAESPKILGYLKIPGYSNYLHPYDETHIIGLGKDANESIDADKVHTPGAIYYTAILGLKVSLYDVSDVENPVEVGKVIIGKRGTDSPALTDHKAFLFDKDKGIIVLPVSETKVVNRTYQWGSYEDTPVIWQGAYVLSINSSGISVRGRITHNNETSNVSLSPAKDESIGAIRKDSQGNSWTKFNILNGIGQWRTTASGFEGTVYADYDIDSFPLGMNYYPYFDYSKQIQRSLFMDNNLYTVSQAKIKANDLNSLDELNSVDLGYSVNNIYYGYGGSSVGVNVAMPMAAVVK